MRDALVFVLLSTVAAQLPAAEDRPVAEKYLLSGDFDGGQEALRSILKAHSNDAQARFGLGTVQFVRSIEHLRPSLDAGWRRCGLNLHVENRSNGRPDITR